MAEDFDDFLSVAQLAIDESDLKENIFEYESNTDFLEPTARCCATKGMANVSVYRGLCDVLQGKSSRNRCVAGLAVSVARIPAVSLDLSSVDTIKTQHFFRYHLSRPDSDVGVRAK